MQLPFKRSSTSNLIFTNLLPNYYLSSFIVPEQLIQQMGISPVAYRKEEGVFKKQLQRNNEVVKTLKLV